MQTFAYTARDDRGSPVNGTVQADTIDEVTRQLRASGKYPISVTPINGGGSAPIRASGIKVPRADVIQIAQQLSVMLETGVTLVEALDCIASQTTKPKVKLLLDDLSASVHSGGDFSGALERHPRSFPRIFISLVKAAERSGMMSRMLSRGTTYLREEQEMVRRVKGALTYPAIMLSFAVLTTVALLVFVLPRFTVIYANKGAALPLPTRLLMGMSNFLVNHWIIIVIGVIGATAGLWFYSGTARGRLTVHYLQLRMPVLGAMYRKLHLSRGLRMIGTMAGAGVNLLDCVTTAHDLCANTYFRRMWDDVSEKIQAGKQMSEPLGASTLVPRSITQMIHSAEKSGKLAQVTEQVAGFAEQELKETITEMTRYIEPAMIVIMGLIIGGVAMALMLPIFTMSKVVAQ